MLTLGRFQMSVALARVTLARELVTWTVQSSSIRLSTGSVNILPTYSVVRGERNTAG